MALVDFLQLTSERVTSGNITIYVFMTF
jgi:hypothetical protein